MSVEPLRLVELRVDIARRLRSACAAMPADEFDRLVRRIAETEYKYEQIESRRAQLSATPEDGSSADGQE